MDRDQAKRRAERLHDVVRINREASAVEPHVVVRAEAEDVVHRVRPVVRPTKGPNLRSLALPAAEHQQGLAAELKRVPTQGFDLSHSHLRSRSQLRALDV
jgi:hypothetical protein